MIHKGDNIVGLSPKAILDKGISMSFIPEDRLGMGLAPSLSITDNMLLKNYGDGKSPLVDRKLGRADAEHVIEELGVVTPSTETPVRLLSGGNVQKVLLGREIKAGPNVLITAYPVRGLDINSSYAIYNILNQQKQDGVGILFVGEDLDVMLALCDKIMVLCHGRMMGVVHAHKTSKEELGLMMTGALDLSNKYGGHRKRYQHRPGPAGGRGKGGVRRHAVSYRQAGRVSPVEASELLPGRGGHRPAPGRRGAHGHRRESGGLLLAHVHHGHGGQQNRLPGL